MNAEQLGQRILDLMAECEANNIQGMTDDPNADPRLQEIGNLLTMFDVFYHADYVAFANKHFTFSE